MPADPKNTITVIVPSDAVEALLRQDHDFAVAVKQAAIRTAAKTFFRELVSEDLSDEIRNQAKIAGAKIRRMAEEEYGTIAGEGWRRAFQPNDKMRAKIQALAKLAVKDAMAKEVRAVVEQSIREVPIKGVSNAEAQRYAVRLVDSAIKSAASRVSVQLTGSIDFGREED